MDQTLLTIILFVLSYLIGSIPFGLIFGLKFKNIDIRKHGSKNIGSTNAIRTLGKKIGFTAFIFEVLKGGFTIALVKYILTPLGIYEFPNPDFLITLGVVSVLGHVFPIYLKFKGGKAVASSLGVVIALTPVAAFLCLLVFVITLFTLGFVSLSSTFATITVVTVTILLNIFGTYYGLLFGRPGMVVVIAYLFLALVIILKHKKNYIRLLNGTEPNMKDKKKKMSV